MSDQEYKEDEVEETESAETTPAGSYRLPGQDVSGFLGVDNEYKNSATPGGEAILTDEEAYLFLPAPEVDEDDEVDEYEHSDADDLDTEDGSASDYLEPPSDSRVEVNPSPARPAL